MVQPDGSEEKARMEGQNSDTLTLSNVGIHHHTSCRVSNFYRADRNALSVSRIRPGSMDIIRFGIWFHSCGHTGQPAFVCVTCCGVWLYLLAQCVTICNVYVSDNGCDTG